MKPILHNASRRRQNVLQFGCCIVLVISACQSTAAQSSTRNDGELEMSAPVTLRAEPARFKLPLTEYNGNSTLDRLGQLQREIQLLQTSSGDSIEMNSPRSELNPDAQNVDDVLPLPLDQLSAQPRIQAIHQRIDILKDLLARQKKAAEAASEVLKQQQLEASLPAQPTPTPANEGEPQMESAEIPVPVPAAEPEAAEPEPSPDPDWMQTKEPGIQVLSTPVNSFELANSLFATGNYAQALKSYEALLSDETVDLDRDWLRCLAANCYRIQGETAKAEKLYRDVAASKEQSFPTDQSKWYLDHLTQRRRLEAEMQAIGAELQSLSATTNTGATQ